MPCPSCMRVARTVLHHPCYPVLSSHCRLQGISDADVGMLQGVLEEGVQDNLGMAMIYTLVTTAQEWVQVRAASKCSCTLLLAPGIRLCLQRGFG